MMIVVAAVVIPVARRFGLGATYLYPLCGFRHDVSYVCVPSYFLGVIFISTLVCLFRIGSGAILHNRLAHVYLFQVSAAIR